MPRARARDPRNTSRTLITSHKFGSVRIKTLVTVLAIRIKSNPPSVLCYDVEHGLVLMGDFGKLLS